MFIHFHSFSLSHELCLFYAFFIIKQDLFPCDPSNGPQFQLTLPIFLLSPSHFSPSLIYLPFPVTSRLIYSYLFDFPFSPKLYFRRVSELTQQRELPCLCPQGLWLDHMATFTKCTTQGLSRFGKLCSCSLSALVFSSNTSI